MSHLGENGEGELFIRGLDVSRAIVMIDIGSNTLKLKFLICTCGVLRFRVCHQAASAKADAAAAARETVPYQLLEGLVIDWLLADDDRIQTLRESQDCTTAVENNNKNIKTTHVQNRQSNFASIA